MILIETLPTPSPHELVGLSEQIFRKRVSALKVGKKYLRTRADIEQEIQARKGGINESVFSEEEDPVSFWEVEL